MKKLLYGLLVITLLVIFTTSTVLANGGGNPHKIWICHATSSEHNPYVKIHVDVNGLNGHGDHEMDIIPAPEDGCPVWTPTETDVPTEEPTETKTETEVPTREETPVPSPTRIPTLLPCKDTCCDKQVAELERIANALEKLVEILEKEK